MSEMKLITIETPEKKYRLLNFKCATCGKEKWARVSLKTAKSLLNMTRDGTEVLLHCSECEAPETAADDSLVMAMEVVTIDEELEHIAKEGEQNTEKMEKQRELVEKGMKEYEADIRQKKKEMGQMIEEMKALQILTKTVEKEVFRLLKEAEHHVNTLKKKLGAY